MPEAIKNAIRRVLGIRTPLRCACGVSMREHPARHMPLCRVRYDWTRDEFWAAVRPDDRRETKGAATPAKGHGATEPRGEAHGRSDGE